MPSDNNCKDCYGSYNEILFWKVIHNKYLFKKIFQLIETIEWVQYDNIKSYHHGNRIKFKDINNLSWMIERGLFELIKCKLEAGEYIEIDKSIFSTQSTSSSTSTSTTTTTIFKTTNKQIGKYKNNLKQLSKKMKEICQLLLKFNCFILQGIDIIKLSIFYQNNKLIKLLSKSQYVSTISPITIYPSQLKWLIEKTKNVKTLDLIINSPSTNITAIISTELKNQSISIATNNSSQCKEELILFIIDNLKLYTLPTKDNNNNNNTTIIIEPIQFYQLKSIKLLNKLIELNYYIPRINQMADQNRIREIISSIWISKTNYEYSSLLNSISEIELNTTFKNKLPTCWNNCMSELYNRIIIIKSIDIIDWILENIEIEKFKSIYLSNKKTIFKFESSYLIKYAYDKFKSNSILSFTIENNHFRYPFIKAISNCDIQELEFINLNSPTSFYLTDDNHLINFTFINQSPTNIINMVKYLNSKQFSNFDTFIFKIFIKSLLEFQELNQQQQKQQQQFKISDLEINFQLINVQCSKEITNDLVCSFSPDALKLIFKLPESNYIKLYPNWFETEYQLYYDDDIYSDKKIVKPSDKITIENVIQCIELVLTQFNIESNNNAHGTTNNNNSPISIYLSILQDIINLQFKTLFNLGLNQVISIDRLKYIYYLILNNEYPIQLNQTLFHLTSYLGCKSMKLFKYIRGLIVALNCNIKSISDTSDNHEESGYDIKKYLNFQVFSFEYIFGNSTFNEIIEKLVLTVSHLPALNLQMVKTLNDPSSSFNNYNNSMEEYEYDYDEFEYRSPKDYYFESFNFNLEYFLIIHRSDLFFKEMEFILEFLKSNMDNSSPLSSSSFKLSDQVIIYASKLFDTIQFSKLIQNNQLVIQFIIDLYKNVEFTSTNFAYLLNHTVIINEILINNQIDIIEYWLNYLNRIIVGVNNKQYKDSLVLKNGNLFLNYNDNDNLIPLDQLYSISTDKYSNYNIHLRNSILSINPQHQLFKFTNQTIDNAIKDEKIEFLKYYYENTTIIKQDIQLLNHLKLQLSTHPDYKYVNWLK